MSERSTGATDAKFVWGPDELVIREQDGGGVQLFARHFHNADHLNQRVWLDVPAEDRTTVASHIVTTEERIVSVSDLRIVTKPFRYSVVDHQDAIDRIQAAIGDAP